MTETKTIYDQILLENYVKLMWGEFNDIRQKYQLAPLILAFSIIEANAKLCSPENIINNPRERFIWWIDTFINGSTAQKYTAIDLYGARCGLFHEYGAESDLSRNGKCKVIAWTSGGDNRHHGKGKDRMILLSKEQFFDDLYMAGIAVLKELQTNTDLQQRFTKRLIHIFGVKEIEPPPKNN